MYFAHFTRHSSHHPCQAPCPSPVATSSPTLTPAKRPRGMSLHQPCTRIIANKPNTDGSPEASSKRQKIAEVPHPGVQHPVAETASDDHFFNVSKPSNTPGCVPACASTSPSDSPVTLFQLSIPKPQSPSTPASSSSNLALSSPLANRTNAFGKPWYQATANRPPTGEHELPHSALLQNIHITLLRLQSSCALCWGTSAPNSIRHTFASCRLMNSDPILCSSYNQFRQTIHIPPGTPVCYGCYIPKVSATRSLNCLPLLICLSAGAFQTQFSDSSDQRKLLCHSDKSRWGLYCSYRDTAPVVAWLVASNEFLLDKFSKSPAYCCGLDFGKGEDAQYGPWLLQPCATVLPAGTVTHLMRAMEFLINLRGLPPV